MVRDRVGQIEPAEPPVRQIEPHLFAEPPLGPDAVGVSDDQHAEHQLGIDRGPPDGAVERSQMRADAGEIDKPVNRAQEMILRHERIEIELVKERALRHLPRSHHRQVLPDPAN